MKFPWRKKQEKIEELEQQKNSLQQKVNGLKDERDSFKQRFQAEKKRRSELSAEKQEAEKKLKKLKQKKSEASSSTEEKESKVTNVEGLSLSKARSILEKLGSVESPQTDLVSIYSPESLNQLGDLQGLKGSISKDTYSFLQGGEGFVAFLDDEIFGINLKSRPFFDSGWQRESSFDVSQIVSFIDEEKVWAAVSAGNTIIFEEEGGEILSREEISSRVNSKQKKGGFSQGRFERKREEQIEEHLDLVREEINEEVFLVGEESLCKDLPGTYLGGFDGDKPSVDALYNFRLEMKN